jgi:ATP-binding cassette subfamily B protein
MYRFIRRRWIAHAAILVCVLAAVVCSVSAQYGVKFLVDALSEGIGGMRNVWSAFLMLVLLIAADNLLWRIASLIANFSFVGVTGDLRRDLFSHLTRHAPSYFADRLPGTLASRVTATSNAVFTTENMFVWQEDRCITISPTRQRRSMGKWSTSSAICRSYAHFAGWAASNTALIQLSIKK